MRCVFVCVIIRVSKEAHALTLGNERQKKMTKYFKITGYDNGVEIEPYGVETNGACPHISVGLYRDSVRYYEPITEEEYRQLTNKL